MKQTTASAQPAKAFFIRMITKDISLGDCILDLLDNCIDGARKSESESNNSSGSGPGNITQGSLVRYHADIKISPERFEITDNCGGISLAEAEDYAFHFGRKKGESKETAGSIGLYGIGMKRALFKLGNHVHIASSDGQDHFVLDLDVSNWEALDKWDFPLQLSDEPGPPGTSITASELYPSVKKAFGDTSFIREFRKIISRDYSLLLSKGFSVSINGTKVEPIEFSLFESDEFKPAHFQLDVKGVAVDIHAGLSNPGQDEEPAGATSDSETLSGWFIICNDRIVLASDKTPNTVWGNDFPKWHPQYRGFVGLASFHADDPSLLPWTTTKRDLDLSDPLYLKVRSLMKEATRDFIDYTNLRKANPEKAREKEEATKPVSIPLSQPRDQKDLPTGKEEVKKKRMELPSFGESKVKFANILYRRRLSEVQRAAQALGNPDLTYKEVGERTFEYFLDSEGI